MLHPAELPEYSKQLEKVLDFQERLLEFGCRMPEITPDDFRDELGDELFDWLTSTRQLRKLFEPIYEFARLPQDEKDAILADFRHDRTFWDHKDNATFQFRLLGGSTNKNRQRVGTWLIGYYKRFSGTVGLDGPISEDVQSILKKSWFDAYRKKNKQRNTCAACDGSMNHGITVEHFLPKSRYPALSMHPYNLLPFCDKCNNEIKGEKDPLKGHNLTTIFIPYRDSVRLVAHLEFSDDGKGGETIQFVPNSSDPVVDSQLQSFSYLFDIPGQWQKNIHEIGESAWRSLHRHLRGLQRQGLTMDKTTVLKAWEAFCDDLELDWGTDHYLFPKTEWLRWAKDRKLDQVCQELGIP